jgi:hypothetical protein
MDDIRIIRLQSGEDVITKYKELEYDDGIMITDPMTILFKRLPSGKAFMMMSPWLPIEIIEENSAPIFSSDILTMIKPKQSIINYYKRIVNETNIDALEASSQIEESLLDTDNESYYDDVEEDEVEEYMESMDSGVPKKQLLH